MRLPSTVTALLAGIVMIAPALARAQEPVKSFDQLSTRLKPGDRVWVTDARGQEVEGRIERLSAGALTLDADAPTKFAAPDVRLIRESKRDSLRNGTLIGLGIGGSLAAAWCIAAAADNSPEVSAGVECFEGTVVFAGLGTLFGLFIDAASPGKGAVVYRAPGAPGHARLSIAPVITPRAKGAAVSFTF